MINIPQDIEKSDGESRNYCYTSDKAGQHSNILIANRDVRRRRHQIYPSHLNMENAENNMHSMERVPSLVSCLSMPDLASPLSLASPVVTAPISKVLLPRKPKKRHLTKGTSPRVYNSSQDQSLALLIRQMQILSIAWGVSFVVFLFLLLPSFWAFLALSLSALSMILLSQAAYQYIKTFVKFQASIVLDHGILQFLPETVRDFFTTHSIDDFMRKFCGRKNSSVY